MNRPFFDPLMYNFYCIYKLLNNDKKVDMFNINVQKSPYGVFLIENDSHINDRIWLIV